MTELNNFNEESSLGFLQLYLCYEDGSKKLITNYKEVVNHISELFERYDKEE